MKNSRLRGKTAVVLPTRSPCRVGLLAEICWTKSRSPRYSPGLGGPWLQMTSALIDFLTFVVPFVLVVSGIGKTISLGKLSNFDQSGSVIMLQI